MSSGKEKAEAAATARPEDSLVSTRKDGATIACVARNRNVIAGAISTARKVRHGIRTIER